MGGTVDGVALPKEVLDAAIPLRVIEVRICASLPERDWARQCDMQWEGVSTWIVRNAR